MNHFAPPRLPPIASMTGILVLLIGLMVVVRILAKRYALPGELRRKIVHIGMGAVTLSFPWLFGNATWAVGILGVIATLSLYALRQSSLLRSGLGGVLDGVSRHSLGELYFPIAVASLYYLVKGNTVEYMIPVLLLTLGDAVAALIGVRYGSVHFDTTDGTKSLEGSLAFFLVAFLTVHVPLLLATDTGRTESLLIGLILGLLMMLVEAISWDGLDNLFIPLGAFLLLRAFGELSIYDLLVRFAVMIGLATFAILYRRQTTLNAGAVLGAALIAFVAWTLGGWLWLIAPMLLFATYSRLFPRSNRDGSSRVHTIHDVLRATGVGTIYLFFAAAYHRPDLLFAYTVSYAAHLAIIGVIRLDGKLQDRHGFWVLVSSILASGFIVLLPYYLLVSEENRPSVFMIGIVGPLAIALGVAGARLAQRYAGEKHPVRRRILLQSGVIVGSILVIKGILPW